METKKSVIASSILKTFRDAGAECERAEFGVSNSINSASALIIEKLELKPNDVLDFETYTNARDAFVAGYFMQYGKSRGITMTDEEKEKARSSADTAAHRVRKNLEEYGIIIKKSESPEAIKKRKQREKKAQEQAALDNRIMKEVKVRSERQGIDEMLAALEIAQGNPVKMQNILAAIDRAHKKENKAQAEAEAEELKNLRAEVRAKVKSADLETLKAMLAC